MQWRAAVREKPAFAPSWIALGELCIKQSRWPDVEDVARNLEKIDTEIVNANLMRSRMAMARKDFAAARKQIEQTITGHPNMIGPRVLLTHALLREGRDMPAARGHCKMFSN